MMIKSGTDATIRAVDWVDTSKATIQLLSSVILSIKLLDPSFSARRRRHYEFRATLIIHAICLFEELTNLFQH